MLVALATKQRNWYRPTGREGNWQGSLPPGFYDSRHLQAECPEPGSAPDPTLGNRVWATFAFLPIGSKCDSGLTHRHAVGRGVRCRSAEGGVSGRRRRHHAAASAAAERRRRWAVASGGPGQQRRALVRGGRRRAGARPVVDPAGGGGGAHGPGRVLARLDGHLLLVRRRCGLLLLLLGMWRRLVVMVVVERLLVVG